MKRRAHQGFALISAIFVMVLLGMLGAFMLSMSNTQQVGAVRDLLGTRAYLAARAGIEWGAYRALQNNVCTGATALPSAVAATGFDVQVACSASTHDEGGVAVTLYQITATASTGTPGDLGHAERQLQAVLSRP